MSNTNRKNKAKAQAEYLSDLFAVLARRIELKDDELIEESVEDISRVIDRLEWNLDVRF